VALNAEVVVGFAGELAVAPVRFDEGLCQRNRGRNAATLLVFERQFSVLEDVIARRGGRLPEPLGVRQAAHEDQREGARL